MHKITFKNRKSSKGHKLIKKHYKYEDFRKKEIKHNYESKKKLQGINKSISLNKDKNEKNIIEENKSIKKKCKENTIIKITRCTTLNDLSNRIGVSTNELVRYCTFLGKMDSPNQCLDQELITMIAYEYGYIIDFIEEESSGNLLPRDPIVTVMGHVDHGKTSLLDYIRKTNVIEKESGRITQHIGAYNVTLKNGRSITFIDTPGHETFTSMRSRGIQITDIIIIVIDANDNVMLQTKEAINHARAASIPMIFALNKIDKPTAQPNKIRKQLANMNILVEEWGGKYQSQEISTKTGIGIELLLDKIFLEADILGLVANPNIPASGTIIESTLNKEKGYISNILIQKGTIKIGDYISSGLFYGKVKALFNEVGNAIKLAGPSKPVFILGINGAPDAGAKFKVGFNKKLIKKKSLKIKQLQREQFFSTKKTLTLDEVGRRIALNNFKEMNIVLKGDVKGSVEALNDAIQKLSTEVVSLNIIFKDIGMISESDVLLASASNALIIGFNVSSSLNARTLSENKNIDIRLYSVIYDVIDDVKNFVAKNSLHKKNEFFKEIVGKAEIRYIYNIKKIAIIAGCMVTNGKIYRHSRINVLRDGIIIHKGELSSLRRFSEDVKEVSKGYECGLSIKNYNDLKIGDTIETYE